MNKPAAELEQIMKENGWELVGVEVTPGWNQVTFRSRRHTPTPETQPFLVVDTK